MNIDIIADYHDSYTCKHDFMTFLVNIWYTIYCYYRVWHFILRSWLLVIRWAINRIYVIWLRRIRISRCYGAPVPLFIYSFIHSTLAILLLFMTVIYESEFFNIIYNEAFRLFMNFSKKNFNKNEQKRHF